MKYIVIIVSIFTMLSANAQFTGTDSLRNYNNKYITNNPATAFTNLRLNTLLRGIIDWVDTARAGTGGGGAIGVDTLWALNDSTIRYRKNGVFRNMILKGVYDTRRKVDTIYKFNDTTLRFTVNGNVRSIILTGSARNHANASLTANADYTQNWDQHILKYDTTRYTEFNSYRPDPGIVAGNIFTSKFYLDSTVNGRPFSLSWALRNGANDGDSLRGVFETNESTTSILNSGDNNNQFGNWQFIGNSNNPRLTGTLFGDLKSSSYSFGHVATINPADSTRVKAIAAATAPKMAGLRAVSSDVYTVVAMDIPTAIDTANKWINDIRRSNDSVYAFKNGSWQFKYIDSTGGSGSSATAGIQTSVTGTAVNYDPRINSNLIFNDFLLTTIGPKWDASNATNTTITFSSGHMRLVGGNAADYIYDSTTTVIHRWTEEVRAVIQSVGGSDYFSFGIQSQGIQTILFKIKNSDLSGTATYDNGSTTLGTTAAQGTTVVGDSVIFRIRRDNYILYFDVVNVTQSTSQTLTYYYTNIDVVAGTVNPFRAFSITLNPVAGTIDIDYAKLYNQERLYADWAIGGMSITDGFNAGPPDSTFYNRLQTYFPDKRFALYALAGSKAVDFTGASSLKTDMLALRPKRAIIMLGINEIQASVSTQTFINNMRALVDTIENHGTAVVICNVTPYNAANRAAIIAYNAALLTEFKTQVINIYDTLESDGRMQSSNDSLHPDGQGHRYMFNVLKDEITRLTNIPYDPEGIIRIFPRGIESGRSMAGIQSNFGLIPLNLGNSGTSYPGIAYNVKFQTTNDYKYKESDYANLIQFGASGGKMSFKVAPSGTAGDAVTFTDAMTIVPSGDIGMGELTPLSALHIKRSQAGKTVLGESLMLELDNSSGGTGQRQEIGMGYRNGNAFHPIVIGNIVTSNTDFTTSDFYIATRALTTNTTPIERFRIGADGKVKIHTADIGSASDSAWTWNRSTNALEYSKINGGATTIYSGDGTLAGNRIVTGNNLNITFDDIFAFKINSDYNAIAKANGTGIYTEAVIGAGNIYEIGFTPSAGVFSKGAGVFIDTNNNVGMGTNPPTTMPLYATGASTFIQGLQSNHGNYYKVSNITADGSASLQAYFYTIDATAGNVTVTLPAASTAFGNTMGITYKFQRIDNSGNTVIIQRAGSDTINGGTSFTLTTQWGVKMMQCTSTSTWAQY